jgi:hypothetical protein
MKCLNRSTRLNQNNYNKKRKIANGVCSRKKKEWLNDKIKQTEEMKPGNSIKTARSLINNNPTQYHCIKITREKYYQKGSQCWKTGSSTLITY